MGSDSRRGVAGTCRRHRPIFAVWTWTRNQPVYPSPGIPREEYPPGRWFPPGVGFHRPAVSDVLTADGVTPGVRFRE